MYDKVTVLTLLYMKFSNRVDLKCSHHTEKKLTMLGVDVLISLV